MSGIQIRKAQRSKVWIKVVIDGVSGSGKTYSALQIARGIGEEPKVIMIDTENGSGELYSHLYDYDYIRIDPPFSPSKYVEAIDAAIAAGYNIIIIDSLSHCWKYILSYKDTLDSANPKASFTNWTKAKLLFDEVKNALLQCPAHVIATLRAASEYAESYDSRGNKTFQKVGLKPIAEPDLEFEFTLALRIERSHLAIATKDRTEQFDIAAPFTPTASTGRTLFNWLNAGKGELTKEWGGALRSEEAQRVLGEADRMGIGSEGVTEEELKKKANELLLQKRREANATMKELKLDEDKEGLKLFADKAKGAGLDPLELFWDFNKRRQGLKTWKEFQVILDEYVAAKNEAEGKSAPSPSANEPSDGSEPGQSSSNEPTNSESGTASTETAGGESAGAATEQKAAEEPSSGPSSPNLQKLMKEFNKSPDKAMLLKRSDKLGIGIEDLMAEAVSRNAKAGYVELVQVIVEAEQRKAEADKAAG